MLLNGLNGLGDRMAHFKFIFDIFHLFIYLFIMNYYSEFENYKDQKRNDEKLTLI
jgi:hypothetical protein